MTDTISYGNGIYAVDAGYVRPKMAAVHLVVESGRVALIDTGTNASLDAVREALKSFGLAEDAVEYVCLTHVHLDHAGGAGAMMRAFPNARLVVHPRGARHMIDPSRLVEGATAVYGADEMARLYGEIHPVDAARVVEAHDGTIIEFGGRRLHVLDTPGHARHHVCFHDEKTGHIFTGDAFGLSYPEFDVGGRQFVFPATTPVQFEPEAMHASIDRLLALKPGAVYLTHFGRVGDPIQVGGELHRLIDAYVAIATRHRDAGDDRHQRINDDLTQLMLSELSASGCALAAGQVIELLGSDIEINAQGLGVWLDNTARKR